MRFLAFVAMIGLGYWYFFADRIRCGEYASRYRCSYVREKAQYEVWYWRNLQRDNELDNQLIGHATGLANCKNEAMRYAASIREPWNERAYICALMKDGRRMEKHRLLSL